ncbi:hypothetical protein MMC27_000069 [Xylographa pallens]|nr:hypothetical protein [Xylographa pallens]
MIEEAYRVALFFPAIPYSSPFTHRQGQRSLHKTHQNVAATIPSSAINHPLSTLPAPPVNAASVEACVAPDEPVLSAAAVVVVVTGTAPVPMGTYGVTNAVENEDVGLELVVLAVVVEVVLVSDDVLVEDGEEEEEEREAGAGGVLEMLKAGPLSGYAIPLYEHAASPAVGEDW